jgi:ribosome-interacting GTPase 1
MPANLPPDYFEAEKRYREARTPSEKIVCLEEMLTIMPKHKGTDKLRADLRRRISKLKDAAQSKKGTGRQASAYRIDKEGGGQVAVVGPANVGKSLLVATLTNAAPEVADFPHTTWKPTPGMMPYENIQIQLIDTPPLSQAYVEPEMMDLLRRVDTILLVVDLQADPIQQLEGSVSLLESHRIVPYRLKDRFAGQRGFTLVPFLVLANKNDDENSSENYEIFRELLEDDWPMLPVSVLKGHHLDLMKQRLVERLEIIRVYSKAPGKVADHTAPFILKKGSTIQDFAGKVHKDFTVKLKIAKVWGIAVFEGQAVQRDHVLHDGDIVELHI